MLSNMYTQDAFDGVYITAIAPTIDGTPEHERFVEKFGESQDAYAAFGYDSIYLLWNQLQNSATTENIIEKIANAQDTGLVGTAVYHPELRETNVPMTVVRVENKNLVRIT